MKSASENQLARAAAAVVISCLAATNASAQTASLYHRELPTSGTPVLRLPDASFYYQRVEPPKEIQRHDIITILVDEKSQVISEGELERRKNSFLDMQLKDWIEFDNGLDVKAAPQLSGDPRINAQLNSQYRTESGLETRDAMKFTISAEVVDIRPNGNLVLEARRRIRNNEETWEYSLTGLVRREDVLPNNTVLSEKLAELSIHKREHGSIFDGYRRGWALRLFDRFQPF